MTTATLQREIKELKQRQDRLEQMVQWALVTPESDLPYGDWPLKASARKRIELSRKHIAAGRGLTLRSAEEIRKYFRSQRDGR